MCYILNSYLISFAVCKKVCLGGLCPSLDVADSVVVPGAGFGWPLEQEQNRVLTPLLWKQECVLQEEVLMQRLELQSYSPRAP